MICINDFISDVNKRAVNNIKQPHEWRQQEEGLSSGQKQNECRFKF